MLVPCPLCRSLVMDALFAHTSLSVTLLVSRTCTFVNIYVEITLLQPFTTIGLSWSIFYSKIRGNFILRRFALLATIVCNIY